MVFPDPTTTPILGVDIAEPMRNLAPNPMKTAVAAHLLCLLTVITACGKTDQNAPPQTPSSNGLASTAPSSGATDPSTAAAPPSDPAPADAPSSSATPASSSARPDAKPRKGLKPGEVIAFAFKAPDRKFKGMCLAVPLSGADLADFNKDRKKGIAQFEKDMKVPKTTTFLDACPTDELVGLCRNGFGWLTSYYSPTFTQDSAKKNCVGPQGGDWLE